MWPKTSFVTMQQILARYGRGGPVPIGPSRWWKGVKSGQFPAPTKFAGRTVWKVDDINRLIESIAASAADSAHGRETTLGPISPQSRRQPGTSRSGAPGARFSRSRKIAPLAE